MNKTYAIISLCCAFGFGLALGIPQAVGLGTPSVDMGSNPIFTLAGSSYAGNTSFSQSLITAPSDKDMRITDIQLSACCDSSAYGANVTLSTASGTILGKWNVNRNTMLVTEMESGIVLPAGEELMIAGSRNNYGVNVYYTLSGQYVRP